MLNSKKNLADDDDENDIYFINKWNSIQSEWKAAQLNEISNITLQWYNPIPVPSHWDIQSIALQELLILLEMTMTNTIYKQLYINIKLWFNLVQKINSNPLPSAQILLAIKSKQYMDTITNLIEQNIVSQVIPSKQYMNQFLNHTLSESELSNPLMVPQDYFVDNLIYKLKNPPINSVIQDNYYSVTNPTISIASAAAGKDNNINVKLSSNDIEDFTNEAEMKITNDLPLDEVEAVLIQHFKTVIETETANKSKIEPTIKNTTKFIEKLETEKQSETDPNIKKATTEFIENLETEKQSYFKALDKINRRIVLAKKIGLEAFQQRNEAIVNHKPRKVHIIEDGYIYGKYDYYEDDKDDVAPDRISKANFKDIMLKAGQNEISNTIFTDNDDKVVENCTNIMNETYVPEPQELQEIPFSNNIGNNNIDPIKEKVAEAIVASGLKLGIQTASVITQLTQPILSVATTPIGAFNTVAKLTPSTWTYLLSSNISALGLTALSLYLKSTNQLWSVSNNNIFTVYELGTVYTMKHKSKSNNNNNNNNNNSIKSTVKNAISTGIKTIQSYINVLNITGNQDIISRQFVTDNLVAITATGAVLFDMLNDNNNNNIIGNFTTFAFDNIPNWNAVSDSFIWSVIARFIIYTVTDNTWLIKLVPASISNLFNKDRAAAWLLFCKNCSYWNNPMNIFTEQMLKIVLKIVANPIFMANNKSVNQNHASDPEYKAELNEEEIGKLIKFIRVIEGTLGMDKSELLIDSELKHTSEFRQYLHTKKLKWVALGIVTSDKQAEQIIDEKWNIASLVDSSVRNFNLLNITERYNLELNRFIQSSKELTNAPINLETIINKTTKTKFKFNQDAMNHIKNTIRSDSFKNIFTDLDLSNRLDTKVLVDIEDNYIKKNIHSTN